jgi:4-hydroxy-2-oxoheptanedioate aldolase
MKHPVNAFKQALRQGKSQIGLWHGLASPYVADLCAGLGYDWILLDGEHAPNTIQTLLAQLQAVSAHPIAPIVRPSWNDPVQIKLLLDMGAQNLLIPMVQNAEQAKAAVAATRYPPHGIRGVGAALARAARWGATSDYVARANQEMCVICQVETREALDNLDEILAVEGVDGIFIGPADLAASMGYLTERRKLAKLPARERRLRRPTLVGATAKVISSNKQARPLQHN